MSDTVTVAVALHVIETLLGEVVDEIAPSAAAPVAPGESGEPAATLPAAGSPATGSDPL